jgi:MoaA/NifB/PqqE/SkfB family radical SAM enzyme
MTWKVVPLSPGQLLDVRQADILGDGLYRKCQTYQGGGGYDQFPFIAAERFGGDPDRYANQFIVQLKGCNLDCPYCYVTREGVWGKHSTKTSSDLIQAFKESGTNVFHLMGGAPALQMKQWPDLIKGLSNSIFHSDLMLTESLYNPEVLKQISKPNCLYAINIKGLTPKEWLLNTRKALDEDMFWRNWRLVEENNVPSYVTFTGIDRADLNDFWKKAESNGINPFFWDKDYFVIDLIEYEAQLHVDDVSWGKPNT